MGIWDGGWSEGVVKLAVWVAGRNSYREAEETLSRVGRMVMSASRIWHYTNTWAEGLCQQQAEEQAQANAVPSREHPQPGEARHNTRMGVSLDGWMVNILKEGWKEVKSGTCYEVVMGSGQDVLTGDPIDLARSAACSYVAHLGEPPEFGQKLWAEAVHRRIPPAFDKVCVSDAAHWIWNLCQDYFPEAVQVVDWFHAVEHLHAAATLIHGEGTDQAKRWVKNMKTDLYQGHAPRIAHELEQQAQQLSGDRANKLMSEATFFRNHQHQMHYLEFREQGWPLGSGSIESGCKQFQARLKRAGMRWSRPGAERMLALRSSVMSCYFDAHWDTLLSFSPQN
jgi:hypothetical protein